MNGPSTATAREYLRVSLDKSGRERSNDEQAEANRTTFPDLAFNGSAYSDVGSASKYAAKVRGDFETLVDDLTAGRFGADVLVLWEGSRGSRRMAEWVALIDLCEDKAKRIAVTADERIYDPSIAADHKALIDMGSDAEHESRKISKRTKRACAAGAAEGRPHGRIPYGYRSTYDPSTGRLVGREPNPDEAPIVVELYERIAAGHSLRSIARDFDERGIRTRSGKVFTAEHLRPMALNDQYRGKRLHVAGRKGARKAGDTATLVDAQWDALVGERLWLAVNRILTDPSRRTSRPGRAKHFLSMIAGCDVCGGVLAASYRRGYREYQCHKSTCVRIPADDLDALAEAAILGYLSKPANVDRLTADDGNDEPLEAARLEVAKVRAELAELEAEVGAGRLTARLAAVSEPMILARLKAAEDRAAELSTPSRLRGLIEPGEDVAQRWEAAPMASRREVARMLLVPDVLGELRITRAPSHGHRGPVEERVVWRRPA